MKRLVKGLTLVAISIVSNMTYAEGIRARGMGEAFHSLSNDGTGWLYNPAGLANIGIGKIDITIEGAETWKRNDETNTIEKDSLDFSYASLTYFTEGNAAFGLYYQSSSIRTKESLYDEDSWYNKIDDIDRSMFGLGFAFGSGNHQFGGTVDMAEVDLGASYLSSGFEYGGTAGYKWSISDMTGMSSHSAIGYNISLGASYQSEISYKADTFYDGRREIIIRPSEMALAGSLSLTFFISDLGTTLTGAYDYIDSSHMLLTGLDDVTENRFGGELSFFSANAEDGLQVTLRTGLRQFNEDVLNDAMSLGLGLSYGMHTVEFATWEEPTLDINEDRMGLSYSFIWGG